MNLECKWRKVIGSVWEQGTWKQACNCVRQRVKYCLIFKLVSSSTPKIPSIKIPLQTSTGRPFTGYREGDPIITEEDEYFTVPQVITLCLFPFGLFGTPCITLLMALHPISATWCWEVVGCIFHKKIPQPTNQKTQNKTTKSLLKVNIILPHPLAHPHKR